MPWEIRIDLIRRDRFRAWLDEQQDQFDAQMREERSESARHAMRTQFGLACASARMMADILECDKLQGTLKGHHNGNHHEAGQMGNRLTVDIAEVRLLSEPGASAR